MILHDITKEVVNAPEIDGVAQTDFEWVKRIDCGEDVNLSKIKFSSDAGTHVLMPKRFLDDGNTITDVGLSRFYGACTVVTIEGVLTGEDMEELLPYCKNKIIFHGNGRAVLSRSAVFVLADNEISLVGIDGRNIAFKEEALAVNRELAFNDIIVLCDLELSNIEDGDYTLAAFPLKVDSAEASAVRAVLFEQEKGI